MQICLHSYLQDHKQDKKRKKKTEINIEQRNKTPPVIKVLRKESIRSRVYLCSGLKRRGWREEAWRSLWSIHLPDMWCWQHVKRKVGRRKNFSTYPKETVSDQSSVCRLSLIDRRYVFLCLRVPRSKEDEQMCSLFVRRVLGAKPRTESRLLCSALKWGNAMRGCWIHHRYYEQSEITKSCFFFWHRNKKSKNQESSIAVFHTVTVASVQSRL